MRRMLKVTALMSSTTVINIILNTIKVKVMAILIGTSGMGVFSLFQSIYNVLLSLGGIVAGGSVVKAVAETNTSKNHYQLQILQFLLIRMALLTGLLSGLIIYLFSKPIALKIFDDISFQPDIQLMSFVPVIINLSLFWQSWLNGLRQVKKIAKIRLFSSFIITISTIVLLYFFHEDAIIYIILILPVPAFIISRLKSDSLGKPKQIITRKSFIDILNVIKLGMALVIVSLIFQFGIFYARSLITEYGGLASTGIVFASWAISMSYVEIFLSALSVEYYPRLVELKNDLNATNQLINKQINLLLMVIFPVLIGLYILAPFIIPLLYSENFNQASSILRYQLIGDIFKIMSWILGYVLIVHGYIKISLLLQIQWIAVYLLFLLFGFESFGLDITGIAFLASYLLNFILVFIFLSSKIKLKFTQKNTQLISSIIVISVLLVSLHYFSIESLMVTIIQFIIALYYTIFAIKNIKQQIKTYE